MQSKIKRKFVSLILAASLAVSSLAAFPMNVFAGTGKNGVVKAPKTKKVTGILFSGCPTNNIINIGKEYTLTAIFLPPDAYADYKKVEWSSSNTDVATVDSDGNVTAKSPGTATITATAKNGSTDENDWKSTFVDITVAQPVTGFTISGAPDNNTINVDKEFTLQAGSFEPDNAYVDYQKVEWSSNNPGVATVDADGNVTAKAPGTATITAKAKNGSTDENDWKSTSVDITVLQPVTGFTISGAPDNNTINVGENLTLQAGSFVPDGAYVDYQKVEWSSNNPGVATVDKNTGNVTAKAPGTVKITATAKNGSGTNTDWVTKDVTITVRGVTLDKSNLAINTNQTETLQATVWLEEGADQTVTWSSSDERIAIVGQDGTVTAKATGKAKITATTANGLSATCQVFVDMIVINHNDTPEWSPGKSTLVVGPVKLKFSTCYNKDDRSWYLDSSSFMLTVEPADDSNIQIQKCIFRCGTDSAEVTKEPFGHSGWRYENWDWKYFAHIGQVDVYFTRNN